MWSVTGGQNTAKMPHLALLSRYVQDDQKPSSYIPDSLSGHSGKQRQRVSPIVLSKA